MVPGSARECKHLLPEWKFHSVSLLVEALAHAFTTTEAELHLKIWDMLFGAHTPLDVVCDEWLLQAGISHKQYLSRVVNQGTVIDELFVWLAARSQGQYLNIIHIGAFGQCEPLRWS